MDETLCPICGREPLASVTSAGNHVLRCDGDPKDIVPRHTVYVIAKTEAAARLDFNGGHP